MEKKALLPPVQWAQRKDRLFVTINIRDIFNEKIDLKEDAISFSGVSDSQTYSDTIHLFKEVDAQESKWTKMGLHLQIILMKKDKTEAFWPRLTKEDKKFQNITLDWNKYVDEDEENEAPEVSGPGWDANQMEGFNPNAGQGQDEDDEEEFDGNMDDLDKDAEKKEDEEPKEKEDKKKKEVSDKKEEVKEQEPIVANEKQN